ncbi:restriction endonuclease subunit S [Stutzerimonas stutzeri]|uniref:restriction endonuclease subunit S n=2 Tax=Stutzerimonas stutzeri TaxID=316 RepID=UPI000F76DEC2|nr:restriction endonuclease subunit S [Stutzerimonas stutzeri]MDH0726912.1 restriction endonuclease subunit S [Stutzerimonas stutzeri]RRV77410.1 restriction endonuclease subunit S [Stutzerimonas stutzeri]
MSHYKPYPAYKDSGVEWLGRVPEHWQLRRLKHMARFSGGGTPARDNPEFWSGDIPWVSPKDMKSELITGAEECVTAAGLSGSSSSMVPAERVLMVVRSGILKHTIPVAINSVPVALNQDMKAIWLDTDYLSSPFFMRWVQGLNDDLLKVWLKQGATVESIEQDYLSDTLIPVPPVSEREQIVQRLDRETARIDALIEKKTRFIELLREKRQALITHAVTKGLDPNVTMKDSGVEWLGEVPEHWAVKRLKFIAAVQTGIAKGKDNAEKDTVEVPYLRVANVQDGYLDLDEVATIEVSTADLPRYLLQPGDVLMNEGGDFDKLGRGHVWHGEIEPCIHQNHVFAVRPHGVSSEWLNTFTSSAAAQFYFMGRSKQSTNLASISSSNLMELAVPLPSEEEQRLILDRLHRQASQVNALLAQTERSIELLKERRAALITAAVTGQIDLREAV